MDQIDRQILMQLQDNTQPVADIARKVGLSVTPCWRRIQRMEEIGVIRKRVALLDSKAIGVGMSVFVAVRADKHNAGWLKNFASLVTDMPEVVEFYRMSGEVDYLLRVVVPDMAAYDKFYRKLIANVQLTDVVRHLPWKKLNIPQPCRYQRPMMPESALITSTQKPTIKNPNIIVFRDKLLLPSEGFIKTHYIAFDPKSLVYLASQFGWRANELDAQTVVTASGALQRFVFKQTGYTNRLAALRQLAPKSVHAHFGRGGALALPVAQALDVPLYVTFHGGDATKQTHRRHRLIPTIYQRRLSQLQAYASGFLCVSKFVANQLAAQGFPKLKLITHYIGIDLTDLAANPAEWTTVIYWSAC